MIESPLKNPIDVIPSMEDFKKLAIALKAEPEELPNEYFSKVADSHIEISEPKGAGPSKQCFLSNLDRNAYIYYKNEKDVWMPEEDTGKPLIELLNEKRWLRQQQLEPEMILEKLNNPDKDPGSNSSYYENDMAPPISGFQKIILNFAGYFFK
jgi:hypothetical protein